MGSLKIGNQQKNEISSIRESSKNSVEESSKNQKSIFSQKDDEKIKADSSNLIDKLVYGELSDEDEFLELQEKLVWKLPHEDSELPTLIPSDSQEDKTPELDANGDGIITPEEIDEYNKKQAEDKTSELDANGDGIITQDEIDEYNKKQAGDKTSELDANGDGKITQAEIDAYNMKQKIKEFLENMNKSNPEIIDIEQLKEKLKEFDDEEALKERIYELFNSSEE